MVSLAAWGAGPWGPNKLGPGLGLPEAAWRRQLPLLGESRLSGWCEKPSPGSGRGGRREGGRGRSRKWGGEDVGEPEIRFPGSGTLLGVSAQGILPPTHLALELPPGLGSTLSGDLWDPEVQPPVGRGGRWEFRSQGPGSWPEGNAVSLPGLKPPCLNSQAL